MGGLSTEELASSSGTPIETITRLMDLGLLDRPGASGHPPAAIARVRLLLGFRSIGVSLEALAEGARSGALDLEFIDDLMPAPMSLLEETYDELVERLKIPVELADALRETLGTIGAPGNDQIRADDARLFQLLVRARSLQASDAQLTRIIRTTATAVQTIVRAQRDFVDEVLFGPRIVAGESEGEVLTATSAARREYRSNGAELTMLLLARFVDDAIFQSLVEIGERALERAGLVPKGPHTVPAIVFADVTGYTRIADMHGDEEAAETARRFGSLVDRSSVAREGRLIKLLGDGAMVAFPGAPVAVAWALDIADRVEAQHLPPVHVGIDAGSFVRRDGDYFGSVVNVASRLADRARPHEVLVTGRVATLCADQAGLGFDEVGPTRLKNVSEPVMLYRAGLIDENVGGQPPSLG